MTCARLPRANPPSSAGCLCGPASHSFRFPSSPPIDCRQLYEPARYPPTRARHLLAGEHLTYDGSLLSLAAAKPLGFAVASTPKRTQSPWRHSRKSRQLPAPLQCRHSEFAIDPGRAGGNRICACSMSTDAERVSCRAAWRDDLAYPAFRSAPKRIVPVDVQRTAAVLVTHDRRRTERGSGHGQCLVRTHPDLIRPHAGRCYALLWTDVHLPAPTRSP